MRQLQWLQEISEYTIGCCRALLEARKAAKDQIQLLVSTRTKLQNELRQVFGIQKLTF
jgi:hypothetical protein